MKKALTAAAILAAWTVLTFTSADGGRQKFDVELSLKDKKVIDLSPQGLTLAFHVEMVNTLSTPLYLVRYDYRVVIEQAEFLDLQVGLDEPLRIEPRSGLLIALPVKITYEYLFRAERPDSLPFHRRLDLSGRKKKRKKDPPRLNG
jgi:hypothetical protein